MREAARALLREHADAGVGQYGSAFLVASHGSILVKPRQML
jgi:hypothetical protein